MFRRFASYLVTSLSSSAIERISDVSTGPTRAAVVLLGAFAVLMAAFPQGIAFYAYAEQSNLLLAGLVGLAFSALYTVMGLFRPAKTDDVCLKITRLLAKGELTVRWRDYVVQSGRSLVMADYYHMQRLAAVQKIAVKKASLTKAAEDVGGEVAISALRKYRAKENVVLYGVIWPTLCAGIAAVYFNQDQVPAVLGFAVLVVSMMVLFAWLAAWDANNKPVLGHDDSLAELRKIIESPVVAEYLNKLISRKEPILLKHVERAKRIYEAGGDPCKIAHGLEARQAA